MEGEASELRAIVFSEFENKLGRRVAFQAPQGFRAEKFYDSVLDLLISPKDTCNKIVRFTSQGVLFVGCGQQVPNRIPNHRAIHFNLAFLFDAREHFTAARWEAAVVLTATMLAHVERERGLVSDASQRERLGAILLDAHRQLSSTGRCSVVMDEANTLRLELPSIAPAVGQCVVREYEVPVPLVDLVKVAQPAWDLTLHHLVGFIDGVRFVKRIAMDSNTSLEQVKEALALLVEMRLCAMVDIFQFSNIYAATPALRTLLTDPALASQSVHFVQKNGDEPPTLRVVYQLLCALRHGVRVSEVCLHFEHTMHSVDIRRLVVFGVLHNLIRRVHQYPMCVAPPSLALQQPPDPFADSLLELSDGQRNCDELCVMTGVPLSRIQSIANSHPRLVLLCR